MVTDQHATRRDDRQRCVVCRQLRRLNQPNVCDPCRDRIRGWLRDLPAIAARLILAVIAPQPRLNPLSLAGPGNWYADPDPTARWWRAPVLNDAGQPVCDTPDDQVGALPIRTWLDGWVTDWRSALGHHTSGVRRVPTAEDRQRAADASVRHLRLLAARSPAACQIMAHLLTAAAAQRAYNARAALGLHGYRNPAALPDGYDPLREEWEARYGRLAVPRPVADDVAYLRRHVDAVCNRNHAVAEFAAELRALRATLLAALGETSDLEWLGRCPNHLVDRDSQEDLGPCGAGLWHDPYTTVVECPRCHTRWVEREYLTLAARIRWEWPIDRRRRYTRQDIDDMRPTACGACGAAVAVEWLDATEARERVRRWRPARVWCPACEARGSEAA
jgi:hypothetical protein